VRQAGEPPPEILPEIPAEERGHSVASVLAHVRELVREEIRGGIRVRFESAVRRRREEDPPAEDDRMGARQRGDEPREASGMEPRETQLVLEAVPEPIRDFGSDARRADTPGPRLKSLSAVRGANAADYDPKSERRSEAICFSSTL
jgi:hypothetical protein